ncbi:MAG: thiamine pyrophosphate-binding protein, partial [Pseudomonadota bacterium]
MRTETTETAIDQNPAIGGGGTIAPVREMTGAEMVVEVLKQQGVEVVFGYPGGAVLPIYDEIFKQQGIR